jgi:cysteine desulfurase / selenocysteine lyase
MNEITPDLIASIASRLYNEIPGVGQLPKNETGLRQLGTGGEESFGAPGYPVPSEVGNPPAPGVAGLSALPGWAGTPGLPERSLAPPGVGTSPDSYPAPGKTVAASGPSGPYALPFTPETWSLPGLSAPAAWPTAAAPPAAQHPELHGAQGAGSQGYSTPHPSALPADPVGVPGLSGVSPSWTPGSAAGTLPAGGLAAPAASADSGDGLKAFVQKVRSGQMRNEDGSCRAGHDPDILQRLFSGEKHGTAAFAQTGSRPLDIPAIRKDFPALNQKVHGKDLAWLDNGATTQKPQSVIDAISRFYENDNSNIHRGAHTLAARATDAFEQARQKVQSFLGASSSNEIVFVRGTTEGINFVSQTYGRKFLQPGDEIILSTLEHHANIVPWQMIAKERGAVIRVIPVNDRGELMLEAYESLLGPRTKLVALTQASNSLGTIVPVAEMTRAAKRYNARVLIDGAQSVSHLPVNMQEIGCDFFVFSGHKIFGPTGIGAVYVNEQLHEILPPWHGGGNMIKNVTFEETTYNEAPAKFEAGTPNIADAVGLGAALDYVNRLGLVNTGRYEHELLEYATEQLSRINGVRLLGSAREKVAVISFVVKDRKTEEVGRLLDQEGIAVRAGHHCAQPSLRRFGVEASVRPSFAFYNTFEEIDRLAEAVKRIAHN